MLFTSTTKRSGGAGGFTCCVPGWFTNNKRNPELSFYNFPNGKSQESVERREKWINLISRKDFSLTTDFSLNFSNEAAALLV